MALDDEKTTKTKAMPWCGAAFVFTVFADGRKLRVIRKSLGN